MTLTNRASFRDRYERAGWDIRRSFYSLKNPALSVLILLQMASFLLVYAKGAGPVYGDMILLLITITILGWMGNTILHGNRRFYLLSMSLFTVGVMLQSIFRAEDVRKYADYYETHSPVAGLQLQILVAMMAAIGMACLYRNYAGIASMTSCRILTGISFSISILTLLLGKGQVKNWIHLGPLSIQTTELVKFLYIFIAAGLLARVKKPSRERILTFILITVAELGIFAIQGEYGTLLLIGFIFFTFLFLFVDDLGYFAITAVAGGALAAVLAFLGRMIRDWNAAGFFLGTNPLAKVILRGYVKIANRVIYWLHPENDALGLGYQLIRARKSILLGGWFGSASITDLPVKTSDLVYPALIQRCGMVFAILVFIIFVLLFMEGIRMAIRKQDRYHCMVAVGFVCMLFDQALIIIGGSTGLCPLTGITLPFISSGGTSLMISFMMVSVLLALSGDVSWKGMTEDEEDEFIKKNAGITKLYAGARHGYDACIGSRIRTDSRPLPKGRWRKGKGKDGDL